MLFTIEIYKTDKRTKAGKKLVEFIDIEAADREDAVVLAEGFVERGPKLTYEVHQTYREVRNIMSGKIVKEHYKTPYSCSVASETYWSS